ncbi:MAG: ATP-binding protein [Mariprofundaceae bacterium]
MIRTFRGRLAVWYVTIQLLLLLFAAATLYFTLSHRVYQKVDDQLLERGELIVDKLETSRFHTWQQNLVRFTESYPDVVQLVAANGQLLFPAKNTLIGRGGDEITVALRKAMEDATAFASTDSLLRQDNIRVVAIPVHRAGRVVAALVIGRGLGEISAVFELMYIVGGLLGLLSIIISAYTSYALARKALGPINEITETAEVVSAGDLTRRLKSFSQDQEITLLIRMLNKMFDRLEASFKAQQRFTADASHELRIPLTVLKGDIEVTLRRKRTPEEYEHMLRQKLEIIERMERIVNGLLTLAKADTGTLELHQKQVDLSLLLEEVGQHHLGLFSGKNLDLELNIEDEVYVTGDEDRLGQVIFNLLNNAYKHTPKDSTISLNLSVSGDMATVEVIDQGEGIAPDHLPHLFERFYRADSDRNRAAGGAGLGLAITKRIVEAHNGGIEVESSSTGTCFRLQLPMSGSNPQQIKMLTRVPA